MKNRLSAKHLHAVGTNLKSYGFLPELALSIKGTTGQGCDAPPLHRPTTTLISKSLLDHQTISHHPATHKGLSESSGNGPRSTTFLIPSRDFLCPQGLHQVI